MLKLFTILTFLCLYSARAVSAMPPEYIAYYDVEKYSSLVGRGTIELDHQNNGRLHYSQRVELVGFASWFRDDVVEEDSWLKKVDGHHLLDRYSYRHFNSDKDRDTTLDAEWSKEGSNLKGRIRGDSYNAPVSIETAIPVYDTFSFQLKLMDDVSTAFTDDSIDLMTAEFDYQVISRGRQKSYRFSVGGREKLSLDEYGPDYDTIRLIRSDGDESTHIWLSIDHHFIPVLIENYEDDEIDTSIILDRVNF